MENKILIDSVNNLKVALNEISVYDFDVYTSMELYYKIAENFNKVIKELNRFEGVVSDEVIKQNEKLLYLLGEGLKIEVVDKINEMVEKGIFDTIINLNIFNNLKEDIKNVSSQLEQIAPNFKSTAEQENVILGEELLTSSGWISDGWKGDFLTGFIHTTGNTSPLRYVLGNIQGKLLKIDLTLTNVSGGSGAITSYNDFSLSIGGTPIFEVYEGSFDEHTFSYGLIALNNDDLIITPRSEWVGTIKNISVKEIIGGLDSTLKIKDSNNEVSFEVTNTKKELNNVFIGQDVGKKNIRGNKNVGVGGNALKNNTTGFWNTAIGYGTLEQNLIGTRNVAIGLYAMRENLYGDRNVALGTYALHRNTEGRNNIALGADTLWNNVSGNNNIGISNCALDNNVSGNDNTALGYYALYSNVSGEGNIGIGRMALNNNVDTHNNVGIGTQALYKNKANYNIGIGNQSLLENINGIDNVGIGSNVIKNNKNGNGNVGIGNGACGSGGNGDINRNVCIGLNSGNKLSDNAQKNILIGASAGITLTTGANNILIGDSVNAPNADSSNHLNIGNLLYGDMSKWCMGIRVQSPTAFLHVRQGNTETPPLKIDKGSLTTTAQVGAIEFNGDRLFITLQNGERKELAFRGE